MGFGVIVASGGALLDSALMDCLVEARVEQQLSAPSAFAVRFLDDLENGRPRLTGHPLLQPGEQLTIAVERDGGALCLVHGPIEKLKCQVTLGGPGSWIEAIGHDRRSEMNRTCEQKSWEGKASEAIQQILQSWQFQPDVADMTKVYSVNDTTLNQRATDLEFVNRLARQNNSEFWISYPDCRPAGPSLRVTEKAHVKPSPDRPTTGSGGVAALAGLSLTATVPVELRVHVEGDRCQTVTRFDLDVDVERPTSYDGVALNDKDGRKDRMSADDPQPSIVSGGRGLGAVSSTKRSICVTGPGDSSELRPRAESALTEAGWFVKATASTTAHMLKGVLQPHDVVEVVGLGPEHSGPYQVKTATHVLNASDHYMDLELRRNALGNDR